MLHLRSVMSNGAVAHLVERVLSIPLLDEAPCSTRGSSSGFFPNILFYFSTIRRRQSDKMSHSDKGRKTTNTNNMPSLLSGLLLQAGRYTSYMKRGGERQSPHVRFQFQMTSMPTMCRHNHLSACRHNQSSTVGIQS